MKRTLALVVHWFLLNLQRQVVFRLDTLAALAQSLLFAGTLLLFFGVVFGQVRSLAGWSRGEVYVLLGTFYLLLRLETALLRGGLLSLPERVERGTLDTLLTRPGPAPLLLALSVPRLDRLLGGLPVALFLILWGIHQGAPQPSFLGLLLFVPSLLLSLTLLGFLVFGMVCVSFWITRMYNLYEVVYDLTQLAQYPDRLFRGLFGTLFRTVLPVLVLAVNPTKLLLGRGQPGVLLAQQALLILVFGGFLRWLWRQGLRRYESASR